MASGKPAANFSALAAACIFGGAVVATRVVIQDIPPLSLSVIRFGQGGLILFLCLAIWARPLLKVSPKDIPYLVLLGGVFFSVFPGLFHAGIRWTEASRGALMICTMPIWSAILARLAGAEKLSPRQLTGIAVTFGGVALTLAERGLSWQDNAQALAGDSLLLLTAFCGAVYGVLAKKMLTRYSALTVTTYTMLFGTLLLVPLALLESPLQVIHAPGLNSLSLLIYLGFIAGGLAYFLWTFALTRLSPTQVAVYANLNPMVAAILGVALLSERLTPIFAAGFVLTISGVLLVNWPSRARN